jgi:hypothetical protein
MTGRSARTGNHEGARAADAEKTGSGGAGAPPSPESLAESARAATKKGPPPVHLWNPPFCGDLDIRIARDGLWYYLGTPIGRMPLVRLFASILRRDEDGRYYLVTPVEKVGIRVDDAPFVAVDFRVEDPGPDQVIVFETNVGDEAPAGPDHPIRVERDPETGEPAPYVLVRGRLEALIDRKSFYRLVEIGEHREGWFGLRSGGRFFPVIPSAELEV